MGSLGNWKYFWIGLIAANFVILALVFTPGKEKRGQVGNTNGFTANNASNTVATNAIHSPR